MMIEGERDKEKQVRVGPLDSRNFTGSPFWTNTGHHEELCPSDSPKLSREPFLGSRHRSSHRLVEPMAIEAGP